MKIHGKAGLFLLFLLISCVSGAQVYNAIDEVVKTASYSKAIQEMETGQARRKIYTNKNAILFYLDRGMINHYAGFWDESSRDLEEAERLIEEAFTRSISQEIASYIANDNAKDYSGEDYEDLYVNVFNALNYYQRNDINGSLIEIRRVNEKLTFLADKYERAKEKVTAANSGLDSPEYHIEAVKFSNSALARYLSLLFYRAQGSVDDVRIDWEELQRAYELAPAVYNHIQPSSLEEELSIPGGMARLNVIGFTGLSPVKQEANLVLPLPLPAPNNFIRFSLPQMVDRPTGVESIEIILDSGQRFNLELLEDISRVAHETFKAKYSLTVIKTAARTIAKTVVSAGAAAYVESRTGSELLGFAVGLTGTFAREASEKADLRNSRYFPGRTYVGGTNLDPGIYSMTVNYIGRWGIITSERKENVQVQINKLNLAEFVCLQ